MLNVLAAGHVAVLIPMRGYNGAMTANYRYAVPEIRDGLLIGLRRHAGTRMHDANSPFQYGSHMEPSATSNVIEDVRWISPHGMRMLKSEPSPEAMSILNLRIEPGLIAMDILRETRTEGEVLEAARDITSRLQKNSSRGATKERVMHGLVHGLVIERRAVLDRGSLHYEWRLRRPATDASGEIIGLHRDSLVRSLLDGWHDHEYIPAREIDYLRPILAGVRGHPRLLTLAPPARDEVAAYLREQPLSLSVDTGRQQRIADMLQGIPVQAEGEAPSYEEIAAVIMMQRTHDDAQPEAERRAEAMIVQAMRMAAAEAGARAERRGADRYLPVPTTARPTLRERLRRALM